MTKKTNDVADIETQKTSIDVNKKEKGFNWLLGAVFLVGDLAGGGMIALPSAVAAAGIVPGLILLVLCGIISVYTAHRLADNWCMMKLRWLKYRTHCRKPYGEMAYRALGPHMRQIAVFSAVSSSLAVVLLAMGMFHDRSECTKDVDYGSFEPSKFLMSYGTMVFAFGGHGAFPTIHHDMRKPAHFGKSINTCYVLIMTFYLIVTTFSHFVYGNSVGDSIISSIQSPWIQQAVNAMISVHVITTIVIALSPMTQQVEEMLKLSHKFGWQRFLNRSLIFWTCVFAALSLPSFGVLLDFIGSSIMSLICLIFPCVFYLYIHASKTKREERIAKCELSADSPDEERADWRDVLMYTPRRTLVINLLIILFGVVGGLVATGTAGWKLFTSDVATPCYIQYLRQGGLSFADNHGAINCCGRFQNVTVSGISPDGYCAAPRL